MSGRKALEYTREMPNLKYLQVPNAGFDGVLEFLKPGTILCNARGVHDAPTAELAVALAIGSRRGFHDFAIAQINGKWDQKTFPSLNDSKIGIIGAGSIGRTLSRYLAPYNVEIILFSRSGTDGAERISELDRLLPTLDFVFLALPLNDESKNLMNAQRLSLMKDGAVLVNIARGAIVDTDALIAELNSGRIFAGLDVTNPEPLPNGHPLWSAKNCIITPHVGGNLTTFERWGKSFVEEQLQLLASGQELKNIVAQG
jgi:phosphoglycerate dehydrogenase-like enzyme